MLQAIEAFYGDAGMQARASLGGSVGGTKSGGSSAKSQEKKLGDIWERFKGQLATALEAKKLTERSIGSQVDQD
jgi:hypothetical protein